MANTNATLQLIRVSGQLCYCISHVFLSNVGWHFCSFLFLLLGTQELGNQRIVKLNKKI